MRRQIVSTFSLIAVALSLGIAGASAEGASPNNPNGQPPAPQGASPATPQGVKPTPDQSGSSNLPPTADPQKQGEQAVSTPSGKTGKEEPGAHAPSVNRAAAPAQPEGPVLVNGALNVNGAPKDSQTVPAKFSARNDKIDKLPIMAMPLGLSDAQKRAIADSVNQAGKPAQTTSAKPAEELPMEIVVHDLGASANDPALAKLKYVRTQDRILLVLPSNRIVVGEIAN